MRSRLQIEVDGDLTVAYLLHAGSWGKGVSADEMWKGTD